MHFWVRFFLLIFSFCPSFWSVVVLAETKSQLVEQLNRRYDNFFERLNEENRLNQIRMSGAKEIDEARVMDRELKERARKKFISERKPPPDTTEAFKRRLAEEERERKAYLERQKAYSKMMTEVERIKNTAKKIPDVLEYQLQDAL